jgi:hypothetical protein
MKKQFIRVEVTVEVTTQEEISYTEAETMVIKEMQSTLNQSFTGLGLFPHTLAQRESFPQFNLVDIIP